MKPKRIILVRHGESEGNADINIYTSKPDYALKLTEKGQKQARNAGRILKNLIGSESVRFYVSSFHRARMTAQEMLKAFDKNQYQISEDPRLREQEWSGALRVGMTIKSQKAMKKERDSYGHFYFRFKGGESCADVYDRLSTFLDTLHRDFEREEFAENVCIVNHGMTARVFLMRWFHMTVEEFELLRNPRNCAQIVLELQDNNRYKIITPLVRSNKPMHPYQMPLEAGT